MITTTAFGHTKDGREVNLYRIDNEKGMVAEVTDFGANLVRLFVPDREGKSEDIVLGFDDVSGYEFNPSFFGSTIGRNANRIADAAFTLNGKKYGLEVNDGPNNLHSHFDKCFNKQLFTAKRIPGENAVAFTVLSPDGDQGFPGNLEATVIYRVTDDNVLELEYIGRSDADTVFNPTNHSYFNLSGHASGTAMGQTLKLRASHFTPCLPGSIPTGELLSVVGTPFDFLSEHVIGERIDEPFDQLEMAGGYDHNYCIDEPVDDVIAELYDPKSGRCMKVFTDLPGVQFYAGNFIASQAGKDGAHYGKRDGVCLETQFFPNAINTPAFKQPVLKAGEEFKSVTKYAFTVR